MEVTLLKKPHEISFTGNTIPFVFSISPYGINERSMNIKLSVRVLIESSYNSGIYTEIKNDSFIPNNSGIIQMDVSTILHPYLEYFMPRFDTPVLYNSDKQSKMYKINWTLTVDDSIVVAATDSDVFTAVKGGIAMEHWHPHEFFTVNVITNKQPLHLPESGSLSTTNLPKWFYWIYPADDGKDQTVKIKAYYDDGSNSTYTFSNTIIAGKWQVCCAPIGTDFIIDNLTSSGKLIVKYEIKVLVDTSTVIAQLLDLYIDYRKFYDTNVIVYRGSLGGLETIELLGAQDFEVDNTINIAQRVLPFSMHYNNALLGQSVQQSAFDIAKYIGYTGYITKASLQKLRDLFISPEKWQINETGKLIPIVIAGKNVKYFSSKDSVYSMSIEWIQAYQNQYYTPSVLLPTTRSCPGMEKLSVKQLNFTTLQISYAMPFPYETAEVEITIGSTVTTHRYKGNTQTILESFSNTATSGSPVSVQVKARVICNEYSDPIEAGGWTTVTISAVEKMALVAVNDFATIDKGFSDYVTLLVNPLLNDYDPESGLVTCVAASGTTHDGGHFTINTGGLVTFKPVSNTYTGRDYFSYTITDGTRTATAIFYINVGTYYAGVFAKLDFRNITTVLATGHPSGHTDGEVWLSFYSDSTCTTPLDVTSLALTFNYRKTNYHFSNGWYSANFQDSGNYDASSSYTDLSCVGTGTEMRIYNGRLITMLRNWAVYTKYDYVQDNFTIRTGTGYVAV